MKLACSWSQYLSLLNDLVKGEDAEVKVAVGSVVHLQYESFFHHYQGSIDFNTVNIHRIVGMYFLVSTGNRGDIE